MNALRLAYHEPGRSVRLSDTRLTGEQVRQAITRIVETWNSSIPRNRVRIVNQPRYIDMLAALRIFSPDEICQAIQHYGRQAWQRQKNAWCSFDRFLQEDRLTQWVESCIEQADKDAGADDRRRSAQADAQAKQQDRDNAANKRHRQVEAFNTLHPTQKHHLLKEAKAALPRALQRNATQVRLRAIALMSERTDQPAGKDSHGQDAG